MGGGEGRGERKEEEERKDRNKWKEASGECVATSVDGHRSSMRRRERGWVMTREDEEWECRWCIYLNRRVRECIQSVFQSLPAASWSVVSSGTHTVVVALRE